MSNFKSWFPNIYFETEKGVIINDDCFNVFQYIPDESIDMILADLPYGISKLKWDSVLPLDRLWIEYKRVIKNNGVIVLFGSQPFTSKLVMSNIEWFREELIWQKDRPSNFANAKIRHLKYHENIIVFSNPQYKNITFNRQMQKRESPRVKESIKNNNLHWNTKSEITFSSIYKPRSFKVYDPDYKNPGTIIYNPIVVSNSKEKLPHPTQKPVALLEYLIKTYTNEDMFVLDNTAGVCSTGVAAENTNRYWICIEKELEYCQKAVTRFSK